MSEKTNLEIQNQPSIPSNAEENKLPVTRRDFMRIAGAAGVVAASTGIPALAQGKPKFSTPLVTCDSSTQNTITLKICAGPTGAPAGFSVQWMTCADYAANGNMWYASDDSRLCKASFSGNANRSNWNLAAGGCVKVVIGGLNDADPGVSFTCNDPLICDDATTTDVNEGCYVFRAFAHANSKNNRSDFTANVNCFTQPCEEPIGPMDGSFCTRSQGYYGSGDASLAAEIACFGGFGGEYAKDGTELQAPKPGNCGATLLTIGTGTYSYTWKLTCTYVNVNNGPQKIYNLDTGLKAMRDAIGGGGKSGFFTANGNNATDMGTGGGLASQTAALTLNIGMCGTSLCGGAGGAAYAALELCKFKKDDTFTNNAEKISDFTANALNGQTVADVLAAANAYLGGNGGVTVPFGLSNAAQLNELVAALNLAFDLKDWDNDGIVNCDCGGMTAFAENHLCYA